MAALDYLDFDLEVEATATPGTYAVTVLASPRGEASGQMAFPFNPDALENVILKLGRTRSGVRRIDSPTQDVAKKFGTSLYEALFAGEVGTCFRRSLDEADARGKGLRLRLRLGRAPQLADVPWEYLYPQGLRQFLVLSTKTPVVRYLEQPRSVPPLQVTPPLHVLVLVSAPTNLATLDVNAEVTKVRDALADLQQTGHVQVTVLPNATLAELRRTLRRGTFHVLHFIGHGGFNQHSAEGMLAFEDEHHQAHYVAGADLATMIHDHNTLRLVLLNACEGARQSPADPLGGVAQSLVMQGIPAVVAMQFEITDAAATIFATEFYAAIADGYPIDAALAEARVAVFSDDNDVEWGTPVLYLRASDGQIFDVAGGPTSGGGIQGSPGAAPATTPAPAPAASRVVPVVVPPWPQPAPAEPLPAAGPQAEDGDGAGPAARPGDRAPAGPGDEPSRPAPAGPAPRGRGMAGAAIGGVAGLAAVAVAGWFVFGGGRADPTTSPVPTPTWVSPTQTTAPPSPSPNPSMVTTLPPVRDVGTLRALRGSVTVDGSTDDWQWQLVARADRRIAGSSDATGDIYLMWDDAALYLLAVVSDLDVRGPDPARPRQVFRGDAVILELGPDKSRLAPADRARPTDAYYMIGVPTANAPVVAILGPNAARTSFEELRDARSVTAAVSRTATGYLLEARIPWPTTQLNGVRAGAVFAANVQVSERKADSFANLGMRSTNPQRTAQVRAHPAYWQALELQP